MAKVTIAGRKYDFEKGTVTFTFANGKSETLNPKEFPDHIQANLALNGLSQKTGDAFADAKGNPETAYASFIASVNALREGKWRQRAAGEGGAKSTLLVEALARATGQTIEASAAVVEGLDKDGRKVLRQHEQIAAMLVTIEQERLAAKAMKLKAISGDAPNLAALFQPKA